MNKQEYLPKLHSEILIIMDEIHKVCVENGLKYYLVGGSLLGAVRHKGFIPWDDDLDIAMPRQDLDKFIEIASSKLGNHCYLNWITTNKNYWNLFPKVCLKNTLFDEGKYNNASKMGIFVDIFPLDLAPSYTKELEKIKQTMKRWHYISSAKNVISKSAKMMLYKIMSFFVSNEYSYQAQRDSCLKAKRIGSDHYANFGSQYKLQKQTMPIEWYGQGTLLPFEDRQYYVPSEYIKVIKSIYGDNYMQLPPLEKRRSHYPKKVQFLDNTIMTFEEPQKRITVNEP